MQACKAFLQIFLPTGAKFYFDNIVKIINNFSTFKKLKAGSKIYRARTYNSAKPISLDFGEITLPSYPILAEQANRMSAAGIPLFYSSNSSETSRLEASESNTYTEKHDRLICASFSLKTDLYFLDLTNLPSIPSIFGHLERSDRDSLLFIKKFKNSIMSPVQRDGREHVEYIPSQIFTEYVRLHVKHNNLLINGICYPSLKNKNGYNYAVFLKHNQIEEKQTPSDSVLYFNNDITQTNI